MVRGATWVQTASVSEIVVTPPAEMSEPWVASGALWPDEPLYCASEFGTGKDNPFDAHTLSDLQRSRGLMAELESVTSFAVRYVIAGCCATGRNFLTSGYLSLIHI